jgi:hypothetical protein
MVEYDFSLILLAVVFFTIVVYLASHILGNLTSTVVGVGSVALGSMAASPGYEMDLQENNIQSTQPSIDPLAISGGNSVSGGKAAPVLDIAEHSEKYDSYEDVSQLDGEDPGYLKKIKNVVIDGNNLLYFLKECSGKSEGQPKSYMKHLEHAIGTASKTFTKKQVFFVMKDPSNDKQRIAALSDMGHDATTDYKQAFRDYSEKILKKYPNVRIVIAYGNTKSRDDYACIYLAELLEKSMLLTRDRFRDMKDTAATDSEGLSFKVYGKSHKKYEKMLSRNAMPIIGKWSIQDKLIGYARIKSGDNVIYKTKQGRHVLFIKI